MSGTDNQNVWGLYTKGVKKLGAKEEAIEKPPLQTKNALPPLPLPPPSPAPTPVRAPPTPPMRGPWKREALDPRVERNLSLGDVFIEAKLDLHGRSEQEAYESFRVFVETQRARGKRMLLVITGKGADGASVLRANLPRWCDVPPFDGLVLAVRTAALHHGGEGAYYVLLRKRG